MLDELRGSWVVINYWAIWCSPCREEVPELNAFQDQYPEIAVLGYNFDSPGSVELQRQIESLDVRFPTLIQDPRFALGAPRPGTLPTTLIVAPYGGLVETLHGPQTRASLRAALGLPPAAQE